MGETMRGETANKVTRYETAALKVSPTKRTISTVTPVKDEGSSIPLLVERILDVSQRSKLPITEIILVDDGSEDDTWPVIEELAERIPEVHAIKLRRNFGKAAALMVGIESATGDIIITLDGDLQDDPEELPRFVAEIDAGSDLVSGWKKERNDPISKTLPSRLFNRATAWVSGISLHDFNCGYKAYRREIFSSVQLYGELHRYIPVLAHAFGYKITEIAVRHHARRFGRSKYGFARYLRGFLDLLTVLTITRFAHRPSHLFGGIGILLIILGTAILSYLTGLKLFAGAEIGGRPLLLLGALLNVIGVQLLLFGMLAELFISRSPRLVQFRELVIKEAGRRAEQE
jgi:glycosyltransferase involved in cell wall biosynthesis